MHQQKCYELLGLERNGDPDTEMTIGSLEMAIVESIYSRLVDSTEDIEEFKPYLFDSEYILLKRDNKLLFISIYACGDSSYFGVSVRASELFSALSDDRQLHKIIDESIVTELERLRVQAKADRLLEAEKRELVERDRLIAKYGMPSTGDRCF